MDTLQKKKLGRTNLQVTGICFGAAQLGDLPDTYGHSVNAEQAYRTVRAIFDSPVNFLDTSRNYGLGRSEERVGHVIRERGGLPKGFVLSTKLDRDMETLRFGRAEARRSLEQSLKALGLDKIQLLHLHDPEHAAELGEITGKDGALAELFRMKEEGLAEAVGLAAGKVDVMMPILKDWDFDALITHNRFMLTNRNAEPMIDFAVKKGIAVLNAAPYGSGVMAKGTAGYKRYVYQPASEEALAPVKRIEAVCARHGIPMGAAALQFSLRDERVASTIIGLSTPERIAQTLDWANLPIPAAAWADLLALPAETGDPEATRVWTAG